MVTLCLNDCSPFEIACDMATGCEDCATRDIDFECQWCSVTQSCYDALDRYTQEFKDAGCGSKVKLYIFHPVETNEFSYPYHWDVSIFN